MPEEVRAVAAWLLTYLLHSSALIAGAWLWTRFGRIRRAGTLDLLWKTALVAGFVTATVAVARAPDPDPRAMAARLEAVVRGAPPAAGLTWTEPGADAHTVHMEVRSPGSVGGWPSVLVILWLFGAAVAAAVGARGRWAMRGIFASAVGAAPSTTQALRRIAARTGTRRARHAEVVVSDAVGSPCALGRTIVLPPRCERDLSTSELDAVLAHEMAHVERRDGLWAAVADAVCRLAWIQPLNRVAMAELRDAAETVCDGWAVRHARPLDLVRSIHRVAEWAAPERGLAHTSALARGDGRTLSARVRRILSDTGRDGAGLSWRGAVLVAGLVGCAVTLPPVRLARQVTAVFIQRAEGPVAGPSSGSDARAVRVIVRGWIPDGSAPLRARLRAVSSLQK